MLKFLQIFQRLHFDLSFADALLHMPKFASTLNENCSAVLLKKLPEKLGDPGKFLIPCNFSELAKCLALADLGASINLMPLSVCKKLSLSELTLTRMTLELANRSVAYPVGIAEDVFVKVGKFHFLADFVVINYDVDPRIPLILGRPFLRTARALIDVHEEELILREGDEQLIFHVDNTSKHPNKHGKESINMINFIDITCEDHFSEVLKFKKSNHPLSGSTTSFSDSLLEEFADELALLDLFPQRNKDNNFDPEAELRKIEYLLNQDVLTKSLPKTDTSIAITPFSVEDLVPIPSESEDTSDSDKECDLPFSVTFSNPLFDSNDDFTSSDDKPLHKEDALLVTSLFDANEDECFDPGGDIDEINAFLDMDVSTDIKDNYYDSEGDIMYLESLIIKDTIPNLPPEVFLDHDPRSLKDEHDNDDVKSMVKVFDPGIHEKIISPTYVRIYI
ncbi:reverse transcriptase domain-containing protein [Tanacetum coccineum]